MLGIADEWVAYCLDQAVAEVGTTISDELSAITGENEQEVTFQRSMIYQKYFGTDTPISQSFRTPEPTM